VKQCPRCGHWHHGTDSLTCDKCWEELGQMQFWQDEDDGYEPPIDTAFDREEEARGYQ
jgi:hypothetical protein